MQFARDAHMAEGWMIAQEPYLKNENLGVGILSDRKFTEITELVTKVILHFRTLFVTHGFPLYLFLERSQRSRTAAGETQQLRETRQYSRRKIPGS